VARADDARKQAENHFKQAEAYMKVGVFDKAAAEYQAAYDLVPSAHGFLFNIGLAHEKGERPQKAVDAYRLYIERDPKGRKVSEAKARLERLDRVLAEQANKPDGDDESEGQRPDLTASNAATATDPVTPAPPKNRWLYYGLAAGAVAAGVALDLVPDSSSNGELDALDFAPVGLYLGALGLGIYGTF
jgi:tetratricopeptide (TPR) repeat protein